MEVDSNLMGSLLGALATLITGIIALCISWSWRKQKGSEVVSFEAKESIKDLMELISYFDTLSTHFQNNSIQHNQETFNYCRDLSQKLFRRIIFIDVCIKISNFQIILEDWNKINRENLNYFYHCIYQNEQDFFDFDKQIQLIERQAEISYKLIKKLQPYALYQNEFRFKKPSL